jgi:hypothetical protein
VGRGNGRQRAVERRKARGGAAGVSPSVGGRRKGSEAASRCQIRRPRLQTPAPSPQQGRRWSDHHDDEKATSALRRYATSQGALILFCINSRTGSCIDPNFLSNACEGEAIVNSPCSIYLCATCEFGYWNYSNASAHRLIIVL